MHVQLDLLVNDSAQNILIQKHMTAGTEVAIIIATRGTIVCNDFEMTSKYLKLIQEHPHIVQ